MGTAPATLQLSQTNWPQVNWTNAIVGISAVLLIAVQITAALEIGVWAASHLLFLAAPVTVALYALVGLACIAMTVALMRAAHRSEPFFGPIPEERFED